jgi:16S rRNA (cytosine1402-N4)-methyltransferase
MDETSPKPPRRRRYRGSNPQAFEDKYKEHQPDRYPEAVSKTIERGQTPAGTHRPIMVAEILCSLELSPGKTVVDCTLGYGGHAHEILSLIQPGGRLLGVDVDPIELVRTEARLRASSFPPESIILRRMNFAGVAAFLATEAPDGVDALLADLGVSSMQFDDPTRGFSFKCDGPLDMRMNPKQGLSASELLSTLNPNQLSRILSENSDEPNADEIADAILTAHSKKLIATTLGLVAVVRTKTMCFSDVETDLAIRRVFQSLRIAVNDEFRSLDAFLRQLPLFMKKEGRVSILTFHSGEDRRVKSSFKQGLQEGLYRFISENVTRPSAAEVRSNPRSSSAKLRVAIRA